MSREGEKKKKKKTRGKTGNMPVFVMSLCSSGKVLMGRVPGDGETRRNTSLLWGTVRLLCKQGNSSAQYSEMCRNDEPAIGANI